MDCGLLAEVSRGGVWLSGSKRQLDVILVITDRQPDRGRGRSLSHPQTQTQNGPPREGVINNPEIGLSMTFNRL